MQMNMTSEVTSEPSKSNSFVGEGLFKTANGKSISVSDDALQKAKKLWEEAELKVVDEQVEEKALQKELEAEQKTETTPQIPSTAGKVRRIGLSRRSMDSAAGSPYSRVTNKNGKVGFKSPLVTSRNNFKNPVAKNSNFKNPLNSVSMESACNELNRLKTDSGSNKSSEPLEKERKSTYQFVPPVKQNPSSEVNCDLEKVKAPFKSPCKQKENRQNGNGSDFTLSGNSKESQEFEAEISLFMEEMEKTQNN